MQLSVLLLVYFAGNFAPRGSVKIGLLIEKGLCCRFQSFESSVGAISLALDALRANGVWRENVSIEVGVTNGVNDGVAHVVEFVRYQEVDLILGSPSSGPSKPAAHLTAIWNFPHISWSASSFDFSNKDVYKTFIRTRGSISEWSYFIAQLFKTLGWKQMGMLFHNDRLCKYCADGLLDAVITSNLTFTPSIRISDPIIPDYKIDEYFSRLKKTSRSNGLKLNAVQNEITKAIKHYILTAVIYLCVDTPFIRRYLIRACLVGLCNGEHLFIYPHYDIVPGMVYVGDGLDHIAEQGFRHLFMVTMASWNGEDGKAKYERFQEEVLERTAEPPWNNNDALMLNMSTSSIAQHLYNAVYFYGLWLNHTRRTGADLRNGTGMMEFSKGLSYEGSTGPVLFNDNGDVLPIFWAWQYVGEDRVRPKIVLDAGYSSSFDLDFEWQTSNGKPPTDQPECGFYNELCPVDPVQVQDSTVTVLVIVVPLLSFAIIGVTAAMIYRKRKLDKLARCSWKIDVKAVKKTGIHKGLVSETNLQNESTRAVLQSMQSVHSRTNNLDSVSGRIALYNGNMVIVKQLHQSIILRDSDLKDLEKMKEMIHGNINPFFGACFDPPTPMALFQYCPKRSLQDILGNKEITLDITLIRSLIFDLVQGIKYMHDSPLDSHGHLKSTNCVIDDRWTLKITDYGLTQFRVPSDADEQNESDMYRGLLWTAPEILEEPMFYTRGTQKGDVYSFAIILHEVIFRKGLFAGWEEMTSEEIIRHVKNRELTPMRPKVFEKTMIKPASSLIDLMKECWHDDPTKRPSMKVLKSLLAKMLKVSDEGNFAEAVQKRLMKYAENLEVIVNKRTQSLLEEKQKTESLLYRLLPMSVADKLKAGCAVLPEEFDSATVYFSDIVGFTSIAGDSTPMQVVDLLNDLYSKLDAVINEFDAYKVETIGDCYLLVSGIPVRNGNNHIAVIADLSLEIRKTVSKFQIKHLPQRVLQLRIGFHTGPCCAGVVGLSMPKYCLFGDTVNTASRMESNGEAQKIHMSHQAFTALSQFEDYECEFRAELEIKGKGKMKTYWLVRKTLVPEGYDNMANNLQNTMTVNELCE